MTGYAAHEGRPTWSRGKALRHVIITGASSGVGAALARLFGKEQNRLTLFGRDIGRLESVANDCRAYGGEVRCAVCDVTNDSDMEREVLAADDRYPVDVVVANAGVGGRAVLASPNGEPGGLARSIVSVNTLGVINTVAPLMARFVTRRRGHFVIMSSAAAFHGLAEAPAYAASKAAIKVYGAGLRRLLGEHNVYVTVVCPGFVATPMSETLPYRMPFVCSAETAAQRVAEAIARRKPLLVFPWQMRLLTAAAALLPHRILDRALAEGQSWMAREPTR